MAAGVFGLPGLQRPPESSWYLVRRHSWQHGRNYLQLSDRAHGRAAIPPFQVRADAPHLRPEDPTCTRLVQPRWALGAFCRVLRSGGAALHGAGGWDVAARIPLVRALRILR